jgi:FkbM family methyltransferase
MKGIVKFCKNTLRPLVRLQRELRQSPAARARSEFRTFCETLTNFVECPFFVMVGANDGVTGDPCAQIVRANAAWRGMLIEPVPYLCEQLRANYSDASRFVIEQVAIGREAYEMPFYYLDVGAKDEAGVRGLWYDQLGSFRREHLIENSQGVEAYIRNISVPVLPLNMLLRKHDFRDIHLLIIDTEGHDLEVLKSLKLPEYMPLAILVEHKHLAEAGVKEMLTLLNMHGYLIRDCGTDFFALRRRQYNILKKKLLA